MNNKRVCAITPTLKSTSSSSVSELLASSEQQTSALNEPWEVPFLISLPIRWFSYYALTSLFDVVPPHFYQPLQPDSSKDAP